MNNKLCLRIFLQVLIIIGLFSFSVWACILIRNISNNDYCREIDCDISHLVIAIIGLVVFIFFQLYLICCPPAILY